MPDTQPDSPEDDEALIEASLSADCLPSSFRKARKSARSRPVSTSITRPPNQETVEHLRRPTLVTQADCRDTFFNPFERREPRQRPFNLIDSDIGVVRYSRHEDVPLQPQQHSIETMTDAEKAKKIAEIKTRPSRKTYFGSDYRLAHKRRHGLQDIHDESDGAWKPPNSTNDDAEKDKNMEDGEEKRTLRQIFDLPDNMIPMNDGDYELAFRDGTLANGKLPRARKVYRVGKMLGGELTVRTM